MMTRSTPFNESRLPNTSKHSPLTVYCDATIDYETSLAAVGWALCNHNGKVLQKHGEQLGRNIDTNAAEVEGVKRIIRYLSNIDCVKHVHIYTDCNTVAEKVNTSYSRNTFEKLSISWIPREQNVIADMVAEEIIRGKVFDPRSSAAPYGMTD